MKPNIYIKIYQYKYLISYLKQIILTETPLKNDVSKSNYIIYLQINC